MRIQADHPSRNQPWDGRRAIALLKLGDRVPRSRSFDVAVRMRNSLHFHARPRRSSVTVAPEIEKCDDLGTGASMMHGGPPLEASLVPPYMKKAMALRCHFSLKPCFTPTDHRQRVRERRSVETRGPRACTSTARGRSRADAGSSLAGRGRGPADRRRGTRDRRSLRS